MANFNALLSSTYVEWPLMNVWNAARHSPKRKLHTARHPRRSTSTNAQPACENKKKEMLDLGDNFDWRSILWHASNGLLARSRKETLLLTHEPSFRRQRQWAFHCHRCKQQHALGASVHALWKQLAYYSANLRHDWFLQEKIEQAPGGFLSLSVFLPFNRLGYTVYVWQRMKRCMFACWATKHQHGKPKCTSTYWRAAQLLLQKSTTIYTATLTAVCKDAIELQIILFQTLLSVLSVKHMIL